MTRPFRQSIVQIDHPRAVEDVTGGFEYFRNFWRDPKIEERWKRKPHMTAFVRNRRATEGATHLARENPLMLIELAVVETEVIHSLQKPDMVFVKNRRPLHRRTVQLLADSAMTYLYIDRIGAHFVADRIAMTTCSEFGRERAIGLRRK